MTRLLLLALVALAGTASAAEVEFFVSPAGQDTHPGTAEKPFATLERARMRSGNYGRRATSRSAVSRSGCVLVSTSARRLSN